MEKFLILIVIVAIIIYGRIYFKGKKYVANDNEFKQSDVTVNFGNRTIKIKNKTYNVSQVTGIRWEALTSSHKHGDSQMKTVVIDLDDFEKPHHKISFMSKGHAEKFIQRLSTALRKAGGPSFV